jgi:hypothetical protein
MPFQWPSEMEDCLKEKKMEKIYLGDLVRDRVSKFEGIAVAVTEWLNGCKRVTIQPNCLDKDGKVFEAQTFDEYQMEVVKKGVIPPVNKETGGPRNDAVALRR